MHCQGPSCYVKAVLGALFTPPVSPYILASLKHTDHETDTQKQLRDDITDLIYSLSGGSMFDATAIKNNGALSTGFHDNFANNEQHSAISYLQCILNALGVLDREDAISKVTRVAYREGTADVNELFIGFVKRSVFMVASAGMVYEQQPRTSLERLLLNVHQVTRLDKHNAIVDKDGVQWTTMHETVQLREAPMLILVVERPIGARLELDVPATIGRLVLRSVLFYTGNGVSGHWSFAIIDNSANKSAIQRGSAFVYS